MRIEGYCVGGSVSSRSMNTETVGADTKRSERGKGGALVSHEGHHEQISLHYFHAVIYDLFPVFQVNIFRRGRERFD